MTLAELQVAGVRTDGNCFEVAAIELFHRDGKAQLVHGIVSHSRIKGLRFVHAWVEYQDDELGDILVCDNTMPGCNAIQREHYYNAGEILEAELVRYSEAQAITKLDAHRHYGPWDIDDNIS